MIAGRSFRPAPQSEPPLCPPPGPDPRPAGFPPPSGAVGCHSHVFDTNSDLAPHIRPKLYAVPGALAVLGVRGFRANLLYGVGTDLKEAERLTRRIADLGRHLPLLIDVSNSPDLRETFQEFEVLLVFDHMGHMPAAEGAAEPGFQDMLALLRDGRARAKLSGAYRITAQGHPPYDNVTPLTHAILEVAPERIVWATDWPFGHPRLSGQPPSMAAATAAATVSSSGTIPPATPTAPMI